MNRTGSPLWIVPLRLTEVLSQGYTARRRDRSPPGPKDHIVAFHPLAGQPAPASMLVNIPRLITAYYTEKPDANLREQCVVFGTSGHRGTSFKRSFNEIHIVAVAQAIYEYRKMESVTGPLYLGMDTHALSEPAFASVLEVLAAHGVEVMVDQDGGYTPTPVISHAILTYNRGRSTGLADGIVITPLAQPAGGRRHQVQPTAWWSC